MLRVDGTQGEGSEQGVHQTGVEAGRGPSVDGLRNAIPRGRIRETAADGTSGYHKPNSCLQPDVYR